MITYEKIKELCEKKGVTISQCERDCGFSKGSLSKIEKNKPNAKRLQTLADYFGVSMEYIMTGEEPQGYYYDPETAKLAQEIYQNPELHMLFDASRDAKPEDLKTFYEMILMLKRKEYNED